MFCSDTKLQNEERHVLVGGAAVWRNTLSKKEKFNERNMHEITFFCDNLSCNDVAMS